MMGRQVMMASELGTASVFAVLSIPRTPSVLIRYRITNLSGDDRTVLPLPGPVRLAVHIYHFILSVPRIRFDNNGDEVRLGSAQM
jgi:hypothetical protein